jgi:hypothetical protein
MIMGVVQRVIGALTGAYAEIGSLILELNRDEIIASLERDVGRIESIDDIEGLLVEFENQSGSDAPMRNNIGGHLQRLEILSQEYKTHLNTGFSLLRKRAAFNKVLAASVQKNRYQDMILRLTRNEIMGKYQSAFNHAARYTWLATQAYDYETASIRATRPPPGRYWIESSRNASSVSGPMANLRSVRGDWPRFWPTCGTISGY